MKSRLRKETLVTVAWIAQRLQMGSVANVNTLPPQRRMFRSHGQARHDSAPSQVNVANG
jgi:hypothetical protein